MKLSSRLRLTLWDMAVLIPLTAVIALFLVLRFPLHDRLIDWTGETDLPRQVKALVDQLRQRRIDTHDMVAIAHVDVSPYGMNTFFEQEVEVAKVQQGMAMLRDAGVRWIRQQFPWADIETPGKGDYVNRYGASTWDKYDRIVDMAAEYGLQIVARVDYPPDWARADQSSPFGPPDSLDDYGDFLYRLAERYKGKVSYYQIWNEPNLFEEWGSQTPDAQAYVELLKTAYQRIKEANPDAVVLAAALSPTLGTEGGQNESDLTYLQEMYDAGAKGYFDIMAVQGYGLWTGPGDRRADLARVNFSRPELIREMMVRNGDTQKPIWGAEMGWNALPPDFPLEATHGRVSRDFQARYAVGAYRRAAAEWPWMGVLFYWYFRRVTDSERDQVNYYFSMVEPDFTTHPVYDAYKKLALSEPTLGKGYHQESDWAITYDGAWLFNDDSRAALGSYMASTRPGDRLTFRFRGSGLRLVTRRGPAGGKLLVEIDGGHGKANQLPQDTQGRAFIDLDSPTEEWQSEVAIARGLRGTEHTATIEIASDDGEVAIDGVIVDGSGGTASRLALGIGLLLGTAVALAGCRVSRRP